MLKYHHPERFSSQYDSASSMEQKPKPIRCQPGGQFQDKWYYSDHHHSMDQSRKEIDIACQMLSLSADPFNWTVDDVSKWLQYVQKCCNLPQQLKLEYFRMNGMSLCSLTENDFKIRAPACGHILFNKLEHWKSAMNFARDFFDTIFSSDESNYINSCATSDGPYNTTTGGGGGYDGGFAFNCDSPHSYSSMASPYGSYGPVSYNYGQMEYNNTGYSISHQSSLAASPISSSTISSTCLSPAPSPASVHSYQASPPTFTTSGPIRTPYICHNSSDTHLNTSDYGSDGIRSDDDEISDDDYSKYGSKSSNIVYGSPAVSSSSEGAKSVYLGGTGGGAVGGFPLSPQSLPPVASPPGHQTMRPHRSTGSHIHLWQFLRELLENDQLNGASIRWLDRSKGVFKIEDSVRVARLWGARKNRPAMNYDKLSRSIRQYYKKGIMKKTERSQRLVYQFCQPYCP